MRFDEDARRENLDAIVFYSSRAEKIRAKFVDAVQSAIAKIRSSPNRFRELEEGVRRCRVLRFPYSKTEIAGTLAETGCDIIEGATVGAPPQPEEKNPRIYVSGNQSDRAFVLRTLGLDLRQIDGPIGAAAALKMSYARYQQRHYGHRHRDAPARVK